MLVKEALGRYSTMFATLHTTYDSAEKVGCYAMLESIAHWPCGDVRIQDRTTFWFVKLERYMYIKFIGNDVCKYYVLNANVDVKLIWSMMLKYAARINGRQLHPFI